MRSLLVTLLYSVCFALLLGFALFIVALPQTRKRFLPADDNLLRRQRVAFLLLILCLLVWQSTLFMEARATLPWIQLWLSRTNFAAVAVAVPILRYFVGLVARDSNATATHTPPEWFRRPQVLVLETLLLVALTLLTPLVVESETVVDGVSITRFGVLFPLYLLHVLCYLAATLAQAILARSKANDRAVRGQLTLIGVGIVATAGIALVTNALLPFWLGDFRFCDLGTLSTLCFLITVAYAVFVHGLFDLRVVVGKALVGGLLLTFVLGSYSSAIFLITQYLSGGSGGGNNGSSIAQFVVLFLAFSFDPLRRFLEDKADHLLFGTEGKRESRQRLKHRRARGRRNRRR